MSIPQHPRRFDWTGLLLAAAVASAALLLLCGCGEQRAQQAADNKARVQAVEIDQAAAVEAIDRARNLALQLGDTGRPIIDSLGIAFGSLSKAQANAQNADASMAAVADVPTAELPPPAHTPEELAANTSAAPPAPEPKGWSGKVIAGLAVGGSALLWLIGRLAPALPGAGPAVGTVANLAWSLLAHRDQKAADAAVQATHSAAQEAAPIVSAVLSAPPEDLPPWLRGVLTPERRDAAGKLLDAVSR